MEILTTKTVLAGYAGTKQLAKIYGEKLVAVRYKLDIERRRKMKTAEIIVDEWEWNREGKYWELPYGVAVRLGLEERILDEG